MPSIEVPATAAEQYPARSQKAALNILSRVGTGKGLDVNVFVASETIKTYGRDLLLYIAREIAPESAAKILAVEIE